MSTYADLIADVRGIAGMSNVDAGDRTIMRQLWYAASEIMSDMVNVNPDVPLVDRETTKIDVDSSDIISGVELAFLSDDLFLRVIDVKAITGEGHVFSVEIISSDDRANWLDGPAAYMTRDKLQPVSGRGYYPLVEDRLDETGWGKIKKLEIDWFKKPPQPTTIADKVGFNSAFHSPSVMSVVGTITRDPNSTAKFYEMKSNLLAQAGLGPVKRTMRVTEVY